MSSGCKEIMLGIIGGTLFLLFYQLSAQATNNPVLLPSFPGILKTFKHELLIGKLIEVWCQSVFRYVIGLFLGVCLGFSLAAISYCWRDFYLSHKLVSTALRPIPTLAWLPFSVVWFGVSDRAAIFLGGLGSFWIVYQSSYEAFLKVPSSYYEVSRIFRRKLNRFRLLYEFTEITVPATLPPVTSAIRTAAGQAWMFFIAAELVGVKGMGQRMWEASSLLQSEVVVVYMFVLALTYLLTDFILGRIQRRLILWIP